MSNARYCTVWCDYPNCCEESDPEHSQAEARKLAREAGWVLSRSADFCPDHRPADPPAEHHPYCNHHRDADHPEPGCTNLNPGGILPLEWPPADPPEARP